MCRCQNPFHLSPPRPVTGPLRRHSPPPRTAATTLSPRPFRVQLCFRGSPTRQRRSPIHRGTPGRVWGAFGTQALPSPAIPRVPVSAEPPARSAVATRARAVQGVSPGTAFVPPGEDGPWVCRNRGVPGAAQGRAGLSQSHQSGLSRAVSPRSGAGQHPAALSPPWCHRGSSAGAPEAQGHHFQRPPCSCRSLPGHPMDVSPSRPQPRGSQHPPGRALGESRLRAAGPGAALPFPPRVSALAEAGHYLPRPSQAAAPGCAPAAYL